jgi:hypothetical protein
LLSGKLRVTIKVFGFRRYLRRYLMEYDEERELTRYVWAHFSRLMTNFDSFSTVPA